MDKEQGGERRMWSAMLAMQRTCFGCGGVLRNSFQSHEGFCSQCLERARPNAADDLGGEA